MQIPDKRKKPIISLKRLLLIAVSIALLTFAWLKISAFGKETSVAYDELIIATVEKGSLIREIRAPGTLVPVNLHYLSATSSGRVKQILLEASDPVEVGTVIMKLDNPELSQAVDAAKFEVEALQAAYRVLEQQLHQAILKQRIIVADFNTRFEMAKLRRQANQRLLKTGAVSDIHFKEAILLEKQLTEQRQLEIERLQSLPALQKAELAAASAQTNKAVRHLELQRRLAEHLVVRSSTKGILQQIPIEQGEQVIRGAILARIAAQDNLKVELRVQESQVKHVTKGQKVMVSAGGQFAQGIVKRIDPAVEQGVVIVDVYFSQKMLAGGRPDLRVEGAIELQHLNNVLKIRRPVFTDEFSSRSLFVLNKNQTMARRQQIEFGRGSLDIIEILSDLNEGDRVVVSDTNQYNELNQILLH